MYRSVRLKSYTVRRAEPARSGLQTAGVSLSRRGDRSRDMADIHFAIF